jgi:hypothetical protein
VLPWRVLPFEQKFCPGSESSSVLLGCLRGVRVHILCFEVDCAGHMLVR